MTDQLIEYARDVADRAGRWDKQWTEALVILRDMSLDDVVVIMVRLIRTLTDDELGDWLRDLMGRLRDAGA